MKILLDLNDITSVDRAIEQVKNYQKSIELKLHKVTQKLTELGVTKATLSFENAQYAGDNDVQVRLEEIDKGFKVVAEGRAVLFIEFGTGIWFSEHPQADEFGYHHGTYGKKNALNPKGWLYRGKKGTSGVPTKHEGIFWTLGNNPSRSMYNASKEMQKQILNIAKEVFAND